ncbi:MAG: 2-oxo acid dehydrogenase subunit E2 [Deltaproteobacteria bacterium]
MYWETFARPIPLEELGWVNTMYLGTGISHWDPMMVWGTTVETGPMDEFLTEQRRSTGSLLSPAHVLVRAVAESLCRHPNVNRRVTGRRVHQYDGVNIVVPMLQTRSGEVDPIFLRRAEKMSLSEIARRFWTEARDKAVGAAVEARRSEEARSVRKLLVALGRKLRLHWIHKMGWLAFYVGCRLRVPTIFTFQQELNGAGAFVNYLGFPGAPPLIAFKPSCLPMNAYSVNVTMGPSEPRPVVVDNAVVVRKQAPLFVRADHRMINAHEAAAFINTLRALLADPWTLVQTEQPAVREAA